MKLTNEQELALKAAKRRLTDFLKEHPELQELQEEIDEVLSKCVGHESKMEVLRIMISTKLNDAQVEVSKLPR